MRLLTRLFLLVVIAAVPALAAELYAAYRLAQDRAAAAHSIALSWSNFAAGEMELILEGARGILTALAAAPSVRNIELASCGEMLASVGKSHPFFGLLGIVGADGRTLCTANPNSPRVNVADRPYFQAAMKSGTFVVGPPITGRVTSVQVLPLALRFDDSRGRPGGIIYAALRIDLLIDHFRAKPMPPNSSFTLIARDGTMVLRLPQDELSGTRLAPAREWLLKVAAPGTYDSPAASSLDGIARIFGYVPLNRTTSDFVVAVGIPREFAFEGPSEAAIGGILITATGLIIALIAAFFGARVYIERPIGRLSAAARRWTSGDLRARAHVAVEGTELDQLAQVFNGMAASLEEREHEQQHHIEQLRTLIGELNHRTKNSLAAVQAMVRQGVRSSPSMDVFLPMFEKRLQSYAKAHDLLSENNWQPTSIQALARAVISPYAGDDPERLEVVGDDAQLLPQAALSLAMAFGELATNATKYGALSVHTGRVRLASELLREGVEGDAPCGRRLAVTWTELGGPTVARPSRTGFGSRLLEQIAHSLSGAVELRFDPHGVICRLSFPHAT